jgi:tripartite-type tricarboxylate transporter receptor subunit TctC
MLAVTSTVRSTLAPEVPTIAESGVAGFEAVLRYGLVAPAGTPRAIVERLNKELKAALASDDLRRRLAIEGAEPLPSTPEEYGADIDREETQWAKVVKASGAKAE